MSHYTTRKVHFIIAAGVLLLDRASKFLVARPGGIPQHDSIVVITGFFRLTHVQNPGAAFGLLSDSPAHWKLGILISFSLAALAVVSILLWRNSHKLTTTGVGLALIMGGALGNLWDRMVRQSVVDFLDFYISGYHWPAFNVADSAIVVGAALLVGEILFSKPAEERFQPQPAKAAEPGAVGND